MAAKSRICVVGTGYIGVACAIGLAELGHDILGHDVIRERVHALNDGTAPYREEGLDLRLRAALGSGRLAFTEVLADAVRDADFITICVGTPSRPDGSADLDALHAVIDDLSALSVQPATIVLRSTVPCGTTDRISRTLREVAPVIYAPEFLREGHAMDDFMHPHRIVVGTRNHDECSGYLALFEELASPIFVTTYRNAELTKTFSNAFLSMKISFANEVANFCDEVGADALTVLAAVGADPRIGPDFLQPGIGFGGPCFEKDLKSLERQAAEIGRAIELVTTTLNVNAAQPKRVVDLLQRELGSLRDARIAVWGLAFKAGTDDIRDSLAIRIVEDLRRRGAAVVAYDPAARGAHPLVACEIREDPLDALELADALLVLTDWPQFAQIGAEEIRRRLNGTVVVDGRNVLDGAALAMLGMRYRGVGRRFVAEHPLQPAEAVG
jgi:UDPglucose 6-dehydrogenase